MIKNFYFTVEYLQRDPYKLAKWCAKWGIKLDPEKTKVIIFSKSRSAIRAEPEFFFLYGDFLSYYPHITKHFEEILECCNQKFHCSRVFVNKKWGPSPETILQIHKHCLRSIFEMGLFLPQLFRKLSSQKYKESGTLSLE